MVSPIDVTIRLRSCPAFEGLALSIVDCPAAKPVKVLVVNETTNRVGRQRSAVEMSANSFGSDHLS